MLIDYISCQFDDLLQVRGYVKSIDAVSHVVKGVIYTHGNLRVVFSCELMDYTFDFKIIFFSGGKLHSVSEWRRELNYQSIDTDVMVHSIFEYTRGIWDEDSFQKRKEELLHKKYGFRRKEKLLQETIALYSQLIIPAIDCLESKTDN